MKIQVTADKVTAEFDLADLLEGIWSDLEQSEYSIVSKALVSSILATDTDWDAFADVVEAMWEWFAKKPINDAIEKEQAEALKAAIAPFVRGGRFFFAQEAT